MHQNSLKVKLVAFFVVAFVCLNAGGAVCVAYCRSTLESIIAAHHCPLGEKSAHCDSADSLADRAAAAAAANGATCCQMTIGFIGAPIEKRTPFSDAAVVPAKTIPEKFFFRFSGRPSLPLIEAYRGPLRDRRIDRLKHCLIRI